MDKFKTALSGLLKVATFFSSLFSDAHFTSSDSESHIAFFTSLSSARQKMLKVYDYNIERQCNCRFQIRFIALVIDYQNASNINQE